MGPATGTLDIVRGAEKKTYAWNGNVEDRAVARQAFDEAIGVPGSLGIAFTSPGKGKQVRSFQDVEEIERETGVVSAQVTTGLKGG